MKKFVLLNLSFVLVLSTFACPVYYNGKVEVVNEQLKPIEHSEFWQFSNAEDSFKRSKNTWINPTKNDTQSYCFYNGGGWGWYMGYDDEEKKAPSKYQYRIKAEGYADVVIKDLDFAHRDWSDSLSVNPVLYIVMQTHQYETVGNAINRIEAYRIKETLAVKDTVVFTMPKTMNKGVLNGVATESAIQSFPNPVVNNLQVVFTDAPAAGNAYIIRNYLGQELQKGNFIEAKNELDLATLKTGSYTLEIKDASGNIRYISKFIKTE